MCEEILTKVCTKCGVEKTAEEFYVSSRNTDGLCGRCKECYNETQKIGAKRNLARETIATPEHKVCPRCKTRKKAAEFNKSGSRKDGLDVCCKKCCASKNKTLHEKNKARDSVTIPEFRTCPGCKLKKRSSGFTKSMRNKSGLHCYCKECNAISGRKRKYGITPEQFDAMLEAQGGACKICKFIPGPEDNDLDVDHRHGTEIVRGLLHSNCNRGLGYFKDRIDLIYKAIDYLNGPTLGIPYNRYLPKAIRQAILESQNYLCKICSADLHKRACMDHDHLTNMIRGALCGNCNSGLGQFDDSIELLTNAIGYLTKSASLFVAITPKAVGEPLC